AFVLLLVGGTALFGQLPGGAGQVAQRFAGGQALQAGLLLPLFFMSFALLESIKSSIGIWWEKAQQSLEVLLYTPLDDPSLIWLEVLPGVVVSGVYVTFWMAAGMGLMALFGRSAPWDMLPVFAFVDLATSHWAAMGRLLGVLLPVVTVLLAWGLTASAVLHSWPDLAAIVEGRQLTPSADALPVASGHLANSGVAIAAAAMAGLVSGFTLLLLMLALTFAAFFLLGLPEVLLLPAAGALWGAEIGFGPAAPLQGWLGLAGGIILLALTLNTAAGLPLYSALAF